MNLCDIKTVKQIMSMFHLTFRKEFGQNFLTDRSVVQDIADACCEDENSTILEIGPGIGTLTYELALRHKNVIALEIDRGLIPVLDYTLGEFENVTVHNEDVMQADLESLLASAFAEGKVSVCANLPYYITSPILMKLLESGLPFDYITVMIQKEVADRLCSPAGGKDYGAITAVLAYYGEAERLFNVPADRFVPAPKVDSAVIRIRLYRERPYAPKDEELLFRTIKAAFAQRRKTLSNALSAGFSELSKEEITTILSDCGFEASVRGERLSIADFVTLSNKIFEILPQ
ncbi:MAG: 16S rRNA (adenine(1518)-N(6)/adenine(1519)-N(6))-dimethyltransferase RsmA [Clostridia bacterium]|nr:16S rRNA (adenine(1518)-N(6)/adenine(1519)-N(6))-dimethyltransferase RsmA [Clostridia bacterium]